MARLIFEFLYRNPVIIYCKDQEEAKKFKIFFLISGIAST